MRKPDHFYRAWWILLPMYNKGREITTGRFTEKEVFLFRLMVLLAVIFTAAYPIYPAKAGKPHETAVADDLGVGGGLAAEQIMMAAGTEADDLELTGIPEPIEFSRPKLLVFDSYRVVKGDTISQIAVNKGLNEDTLLSVNQIKNSRLLQIGQILKIPNQDGIYYEADGKDTLAAVAEKYNTEPEAIKTVNELFTDSLLPNSAGEKISLFIPGAKMDFVNRQEINGDLFIWPINGYISSPYGYREDPFGRGRQFHYGLDIAAPSGTVIKAAMAGRISTAGFDDSYGNYVIISHHSGYRTLYAHMSSISVKPGSYVVAGERIGLVGSTGLSTAPHLHFTVYKNGVTVNPRSLMK